MFAAVTVLKGRAMKAQGIALGIRDIKEFKH